MVAEVENQEVEEEVEQDGEDNTAIEKEAREMGWQPENEWDGPKGKWINAKEFVDRGNHILPIVRANAKKMKDELLTRDKEVSTLKESLANANKTLEALRKAHSEDTKRQVDEAISDLKERFKQAREVGDTDLELQIGKNIKTLEDKAEKITEEHEEGKPLEKKDEKKDEPLSPEFLDWKKENPWFGNEDSDDDLDRSDRLMRIAGRLRREGNTIKGRPFMDKCMEILEAKEKGTSGRPKSKVESGGNSRGGGGGREWDSLPAEAKAACHEDNSTFVGPGKQFKTVKEWEDHYANLYKQ